ncbi:hypothetical protein OSB04_027470 [Centaurea solstitialis]|uniref:Uncharacterized protein n=1 Tax=Centaurea solstitialis TaxID=347529 RepID=A0AA38W8B4_9ASTR|nr:hypothetical protein OSB04_027470 [Centaurea solstitialis]
MEKQLIKKLNTNRFDFLFDPNFEERTHFREEIVLHDGTIQRKGAGSRDLDRVKRPRWKFRGNYTILVDGLPVEVYWDVYDWFNNNGGGGKLIGGNVVFLFQTCLLAEKLWDWR